MTRYIVMGGIIMIPIGIVSVIALALVIEKFLTFARWSRPSPSFLTSVYDAIRKNRWESAQTACQNSKHPVARIFEAGLGETTKAVTDLRSVEETMKLAGDTIIHELEGSLKFLGSLVTILPLLGFLGTIVGLIMSFERWQTLGANITIGELSGGMYQAMITTAAGLILAIPYYLFYQHLLSRLETIELELSQYATEFLSRVRQTVMGMEQASALPEKQTARAYR